MESPFHLRNCYAIVCVFLCVLFFLPLLERRYTDNMLYVAMLCAYEGVTGTALQPSVASVGNESSHSQTIHVIIFDHICLWHAFRSFFYVHHTLKCIVYTDAVYVFVFTLLYRQWRAASSPTDCRTST